MITIHYLVLNLLLVFSTRILYSKLFFQLKVPTSRNISDYRSNCWILVNLQMQVQGIPPQAEADSEDALHWRLQVQWVDLFIGTVLVKSTRLSKLQTPFSLILISFYYSMRSSQEVMQILQRECNQALALNDFIRVVEITDKIAKAEQLMDNEAKLLSLIEKATKAVAPSAQRTSPSNKSGSNGLLPSAPSNAAISIVATKSGSFGLQP